MNTIQAPDHGDDEPFIPVERVFARYKVRRPLPRYLSGVKSAPSGLFAEVAEGLAKFTAAICQGIDAMGKLAQLEAVGMERMHAALEANVPRDDNVPNPSFEVADDLATDQQRREYAERLLGRYSYPRPAWSRQDFGDDDHLPRLLGEPDDDDHDGGVFVYGPDPDVSEPARLDDLIIGDGDPGDETDTLHTSTRAQASDGVEGDPA